MPKLVLVKRKSDAHNSEATELSLLKVVQLATLHITLFTFSGLTYGFHILIHNESYFMIDQNSKRTPWQNHVLHQAYPQKSPRHFGAPEKSSH